MRGRWLDLLLAAVFAFLAVGYASVAVSALVSDGPAHPEFVSATIATAAIFAAFSVWTVFGTS